MTLVAAPAFRVPPLSAVCAGSALVNHDKKETFCVIGFYGDLR